MIDLLTLDIASLTFNGWILSVFFAFVIIVVACTGSSSSSSLVFSLRVWVCQISGVHLSHYQLSRVYGGTSIRVWSTICSEPEMPGNHHRLWNQGPINKHPCTSSISMYLHWPSIQLAYSNVDLTIITLGMANSTLYCLIIAG